MKSFFRVQWNTPQVLLAWMLILVALSASCKKSSKEITGVKSVEDVKNSQFPTADSVVKSPGISVPFFSWFKCDETHPFLKKELLLTELSNRLKTARERNKSSPNPVDARNIRVGNGSYFADDPVSTVGFGNCLLIVTLKPGTILPFFSSFKDSISDFDLPEEPELVKLVKSDASGILYRFPTYLSGTALVLRDPEVIESAEAIFNPSEASPSSILEKSSILENTSKLDLIE